MVDWDRIENFVGYGRLDAPVVFIGMEEGGYGANQPEKLLADLNRRSSFREIEAYAGHSGAIQRTWRVACSLMLHRQGNTQPSVAELVAYQDTKFARPDGEVLLTELMPYPNNRLSSWPAIYAERETRAGYYQRLLPARTKLIRDVLAASKRELIVAYGKGHWPAYASIFGVEIKSGVGGAFRSFDWNGARVVFCPHFVSRSFNSNASVAQFAKYALGDGAR